MSATSSLIAIQIEGLSKVYSKPNKTTLTAVETLNLSVPTGQVLGFLGPNGAGKTTTIKMICGLVLPTSGCIRLNGFDVTRQHDRAMQQIGAVLEGTRNIYWRLSAWENLMYFGRIKGKTGAILRQRAEQLLRDLELWNRRTDLVGNFSRGMQQKVAIACALIADPSIVLLDEPTLGLDVQAAQTVKEWVHKLSHEQGKTVILTTHQLDMAQELCDRVAIISKGKLIADEPTVHLLDLFRQEFCEITLQGPLHGMEIPAGFSVHDDQDHGQVVTLSGSIKDQQALYQLLDRARALNIPLISVKRVEPDLEEIFVRLLKDGRVLNDSQVSQANA